MGSDRLLTITDLRAGWQRPVLGPLSLALERGEVVGLWGANGSGKSTLLAAVADGARIFAGGIERAPGLTLAVQPQAPVRLPRLPVTGRELLRAAGADAHGLPDGLAAALGRRIDRLSGGQYQLLCVWAALRGGADLVLLDEPTNNLDPAHEALLADMLSRDAAVRGVLVVSHERVFLERTCGRIIEFGFGT
jgi:zinc transport system ATP-binding protein